MLRTINTMKTRIMNFEKLFILSAERYKGQLL